MFHDLDFASHVTWPGVIALAWLVGEVGHRLTRLPRISFYGVVGFVCGQTQTGLLPASGSAAGTLLANIAFGLILFEFGHRIHLRWLLHNRWLGASGLLESVLTFAAVYGVARWWGATNVTAMLLASLSMSTSPAAVMRVVNEERCAGQVTERMLHLAALNCVLAVFTFKVIVGFWVFESSGSLLSALSTSLLVVAGSVALGVLFGFGVPSLLRQLRRVSQDATLAMAVAVILLVGLAHALKLSPLVATLAFGLMARHRRVVLTPTQRNFGALGDLLVVVLFTYAAATLEWPRVMAGLGLGLVLVVVRLLAKVAGVTALSWLSGVSWRKGALTGLALTPISVFVILLLEQTRYLGIDLLDQLAPLAAATLVLQLLGPIVTQRALVWAGESREQRKPDAPPA